MTVRKHILDKKPDEVTLDMCLQFARTSNSKPIWSISIQQCRQCEAYFKALFAPQIIQIPQVTVQITEEKSCVWCGGEQHDRADCPAADSQCSKCN